MITGTANASNYNPFYRKEVISMKKSFIDFIKDKYKNYRYPVTLPQSMLSRLSLENLFKEDFEEYEKYLQRVEEVKTIPNYSL